MKRICFAILLPLMLLTSCTEKSSDDVVSEGLITIPNVPNQWSYVSLIEGRVVGTCALSDTATQRLWAQRTDWDLATCNGMIRTNGGNSGRGFGAAAMTSDGYDETEPSQPADYVTDCDSVEIW